LKNAYVVVGALVVGLLYVAQALRIFFRARGARVVRCPATRTGARVELDAMRAALLLAPPSQHTVRRCSLWPDRADCAQLCCDEGPLLSAGGLGSVVMRWYDGKACAVCDRAIPPFIWGEFTPGLLSPLGDLVEWRDVEIGSVFQVLDTHRPVCARCDVAERFRRQPPRLVASR
jgi:hypothetical protein